MKVLVIGGTGVVGAGAIPEIIEAGHCVRLLSRGAQRDARQYPEAVEPFQADVSDRDALSRAAAGCDAVIHIAGIIEEKPPEITFEKINVEGTRNVIAAAEGAGVGRLIFISSLGAERGQSEYHRSKWAAETLVQSFSREWIILRPGNVYGPGDDVISAMLKMVRGLPVAAVVDEGDQPFQPVWFADLGRAIAASLQQRNPGRHTFELAGNEITTTADIIQRLKAITQRQPIEISVSAGVAAVAASAAENPTVQKLFDKAGLSFPLNTAKLKMLLAENVIELPATNALIDVFHITPLSLDEGLRILADELPELMPDEGVGAMERKRYWADLTFRGSPSDLMTLFRENFTDVMPIEFDAEPGSNHAIVEGATLTAAVPARGNIQIRVEEVTESKVTFATVEGHFLAGVVSFHASTAGSAMRFTVEVIARASNVFDWLAMRTIGRVMQKQNWKKVVTRFAEIASAAAPPVHTESTSLDDAEAQQVERWMEDLVQRRKRVQANNAQSPS